MNIFSAPSTSWFPAAPTRTEGPRAQVKSRLVRRCDHPFPKTATMITSTIHHLGTQTDKIRTIPLRTQIWTTKTHIHPTVITIQIHPDLMVTILTHRDPVVTIPTHPDLVVTTHLPIWIRTTRTYIRPTAITIHPIHLSTLVWITQTPIHHMAAITLTATHLLMAMDTNPIHAIPIITTNDKLDSAVDMEKEKLIRNLTIGTAVASHHLLQEMTAAGEEKWTLLL